jgi:hypothetical protein
MQKMTIQNRLSKTILTTTLQFLIKYSDKNISYWHIFNHHFFINFYNYLNLNFHFTHNLFSDNCNIYSNIQYRSIHNKLINTLLNHLNYY